MQNVLESLANFVWKFSRVDKHSLHDMNKKVVRVMVELDRYC